MQNYNHLNDMTESQLTRFVTYIDDLLYRVRKFGWCVHMRPVWIIGKLKAKDRIKQLQNRRGNETLKLVPKC